MRSLSKAILYCFGIFLFCLSCMSANVWQSKTRQEKNLRETIKTNVESLIGINKTPSAKCDLSWQKKVCDGSIMCYATKCFYPQADISMLHRIFLDSLIKNLKNINDVSEQEFAAHLSHIAKFGLPKDNKQHDFVFIDSNNIECNYTLWKKDDKTLFFDLSGCLKSNQNITRTLIQKDMGTIELYEHIAY